MPCMCGKWFWQRLKLMISTCAIVENHQKEKCRQKHLQGPQMEKPQGLRDRSCGERNFLYKKEIKRILLIENVNLNPGNVSSVVSARGLKRTQQPCEGMSTRGTRHGPLISLKKLFVLPALWSSERDVPISALYSCGEVLTQR